MRAKGLDPEDVTADGLYKLLFAAADQPERRKPAFVRWKGVLGAPWLRPGSTGTRRATGR